MKDLILIIPCHRIPERCLHIKNKPMPICARCFSMLFGYLLIPIGLFLSIEVPLWLSVALAFPLLVDGFTQKWGWRKSNNTIRCVTGFSFGVGQSFFVLSMVKILVGWAT